MHVMLILLYFSKYYFLFFKPALVQWNECYENILELYVCVVFNW